MQTRVKLLGGGCSQIIGEDISSHLLRVSAPLAAPIQPRKVTLLLVLISIVAVCVVMECALLSGVIIRGSSAQRRSQGGAGGKMPPKVSLFPHPPKNLVKRHSKQNFIYFVPKSIILPPQNISCPPKIWLPPKNFVLATCLLLPSRGFMT